MKKTIVFLMFAALSFNSWAKDSENTIEAVKKEKTATIVPVPIDDVEMQIDTIVKTTVISTDSVMPGGDVHSTDSVLVETIIERVEPMVVMYEKREWGKFIISIFGLLFLIISVWYKRRKDKKSGSNE